MQKIGVKCDRSMKKPTSFCCQRRMSCTLAPLASPYLASKTVAAMTAAKKTGPSSINHGCMIQVNDDHHGNVSHPAIWNALVDVKILEHVVDVPSNAPIHIIAVYRIQHGRIPEFFEALRSALTTKFKSALKLMNVSFSWETSTLMRCSQKLLIMLACRGCSSSMASLSD